MKKISIILACALLALAACTKSKEVHPEIGDGNDEIMTVGMKDVHVEYTRTDHAELQKVVFHYSLTEAQQFVAAEMAKRETFFELTLNDLLSDTLYSYYYELFPNSGDTFNTSQKTFRTQAFDSPEPPTPPSDVPEGAINGLFTINENCDQVYFSKGNLQYQASTNIWRFAENQWDYVGTQTPDESGNMGGTVIGSDNRDISPTYSGWIDLFGWGTSGWNNGNIYYLPYDTEYFTDSEIGGGYGPTDGTNYNYDLTGIYANADWGVYNAIDNGGDMPDEWRTLSLPEWIFIFNSRTSPSGIRYAKGIVNGVNGIILLPDDWDASIYTLFYTNDADVPFNTNEIALAEWETMEANGVVFLPVTGIRNATSVNYVGSYGEYWSTSSLLGYAGSLYFGDPILAFPNGNSRVDGRCVRLVQDAN